MPLTIFFSSPGTYIIDDDGIRGNNTSVVRDINGNILFPFVHPGDVLNFICQVPGITFIFNTADSFGTANVNVGSLTDPTQCPDAIVVNQMRSDAFITLAATGSITEAGSDSPPDILAAGLTLSAGTGIGVGNAIETQITFIEAETNTGGINLANIGAVQIGGLTPEVAGLNVVTSGDINFSTVGFIVMADSTAAQSIRGGTNSGNVTLIARGFDSDIFTNINNKAISAPGGSITLIAGRDVVLGTSGTNFDNDLLSTTGVTIVAGRDFVVDGTTDIRTGAFGGIVGGEIMIQAGRNISLTNTAGGLQTIQAYQGNLSLITGQGGTFLENASFPGSVQTTADILVVADNVVINSGGLNTTGIGQVAIRSATPGRAINIGTGVDGPAALGLSDSEIDQIYSLNLSIGDVLSGPVNFSAAITPFLLNNIVVRSATEILLESSINYVGALTLLADSVYQLAASTLTLNSLQIVVDGDADPGVGGLVALNGTINAPSIAINGNGDADSLSGSGAGETLVGSAGNDTLRGNGGADMLDGGLGTDMMFGGLGNDFFFVDNAGDTVVEAAGEGSDRVFASTSYILGMGQSVETLSTDNQSGTATIDLTGNALTQTIFGNEGVNTLDSGGGGDTMFGLGGNDAYIIRASTDRAIEAVGGGMDRVFAAVTFTLEAGSEVEMLTTTNNGGSGAINLTGNSLTQAIFGNAGANTLDSGGGGDTMVGFGGDDFYFIRSSSDRAVEAAAGGTDRVFAGVSFFLEAGSEVETLGTVDNAAATAINLSGNALAQTIFGNAGVNILDSGGGGDSMFGFGGDDFYFVRSAGDRAIESNGGGNDRVLAAVSFTLEAGSSIETFSTADNAGTTAINLFGNELVQSILGNAGANILDGKSGADTMTGLGGADTFAFTSGLGGGNIDVITDFVSGVDKIALAAGIFAGLVPGALPGSAFVIGTAAGDADDRIIYNNATGALLFDADGTGVGASVQFATLQGAPAISVSDFVVL